MDGRVVADHARVWARGMTITDPSHVSAAKALRVAFQARHAGSHQRAVAEGQDVPVRDLGDYDRAFGITSEGVA